MSSQHASMKRCLVASGVVAILMGTAMIVPAVVDRFEHGRMSGVGTGFIAAGTSLMICGGVAVVCGSRREGTRTPSGVRATMMANAIFLAFLGLELSDRAVRQHGQLFYWTTFLLPVALLLFAGLVTARVWAWWVARGIAAAGILWFLIFLLIVPIAPLQANGVPAPWYGRVYVACVTLAFAGVLAGAFQALGQAESRRYFGLSV